jgi:hypothetical protein
MYDKSKLILGILLVLMLTSNSTSADLIDASSGMAPSKIEQGSVAEFSGTIYNVGPTEVYVQSMNVSFVEDLGAGANAKPKSYNLTSSYIDDPYFLPSNNSFTDAFKEIIDFDATIYNVSIFFAYSNTSVSPASTWHKAYALTNQSVVIVGVTEIMKVFYGFVIAFSVIAVIVIALMIRSKYFKK